MLTSCEGPRRHQRLHYGYTATTNYNLEVEDSKKNTFDDRDGEI